MQLTDQALGLGCGHERDVERIHQLADGRGVRTTAGADHQQRAFGGDQPVRGLLNCVRRGSCSELSRWSLHE